MLRFITHRKIRNQIRVFLKWRERKGLGSTGYEEWLLLFYKKTVLTDAFDIMPLDIKEFCNYVRTIRGGTYPSYRSELVLRQFVRFYSARGKMMDNLKSFKELLFAENVRSLADIDRNRELVQNRLRDPKRYSWRVLGRYYNIHFTTAKQIFNRDRDKYGLKTKWNKGFSRLSTGR